MKLPFRHGAPGDRTRGQAMVEFALILPLLVLLLVLSIDFGRVFFGWVALNNSVRIAANSAAQNPDTWDGTGTTAEKDEYRDEVIRDLQSINCRPSSGPTWNRGAIPDPVFTNVTGTADPYELGDRVTVTMRCNLTFLTPIVGLILGNPFAFNAEADFAVRGGIINGVPIGGTIPPPPTCIDAVVPNLVGQSVGAARGAWSGAGFTGAFTPLATAGRDAETVSAQNTSPASTVGACIPKTATVTVTSSPVSTCTSPDAAVPNMVGSTVSAARTSWTGSGFSATNINPATGSATNVVSAQSIPAGSCRPVATATITLTHGAPPPPPPPTCTMNQLVGVRVNEAEAAWRTVGFTGTFTDAPGNGNYYVQYQSLIGGQPYPCNSNVTVGPVSTP